MPLAPNDLVQALVADRARVLAYILSIVRDEHIAEDVYQEVCTIAIQKQAQINDAGHLGKWVRVTARHRALKAAEKSTRSPAILDDDMLDLLDSHWDSLAALESSDTLDALRRCMDELSPYAKELVLLRYVEGLSGQALADRVDRRLNTVQVALSRTHRALAECVKKKLREGATDG